MNTRFKQRGNAEGNYISASRPGGGHSPAKGVCGPQEPFFTPLLPFTRPQLESKSIHKTHLKDKCKILPSKSTVFRNRAIFRSRSSNLAPILSKKAQKFDKLSVLKPSFDESLFTRPHFHCNLSTQKPPSSEIQAIHRPTYQKKKI